MSGENREPPVEPKIGRSLEMARQSRGLSLRQVEQETRIRSRYLRDLEREEFDVLPAVYVLGSLKTYADFLGLDGAALSRQLKARLVRPAEPDVPAQLATLGGTPGEDDEYEAAPAWAVGFDRLFLGFGVILISILAVMTLVAAVAQGDESPVSQVREPSTPEAAPSEIALTGNLQDGDDGVENDGASASGNKEDRPEDDEPEAPRSDEESKDEGEKDDQDASSQASSPFGDVELVPMSPSSSNTASASTASTPASAASASAAPASVSPASVSPAPSSPAPSSPAPSSSTPSSPAPATDAPAAAASTSAPSDAGATSVPEAGGSGAEPGSASARPAPASGSPSGPNPQGTRPVEPDRATLAGGITEQVIDTVSPLR